MKPFTLVHCDHIQYAAELRADARGGFTSPTRRLSPRWCFDGRGRALFHRLSSQPGHHPLAAESAILAAHATEIAESTRARHIIHIGPFELSRITSLVQQLIALTTLHSISFCDTPHGRLDQEITALDTLGHQIETYHVISALPTMVPPLPGRQGRLIACPASVFTALSTMDRFRLLSGLRKRCDHGDRLLISAPLPGALAGHTGFFTDDAGDGAEFNRNVLNVINHTLDTDATASAFDHVVAYVPDGDRIELRLRSRAVQRWELRTLGFHIDLPPGEEVRTYSLSGMAHDVVAAELAEAGFQVERTWSDGELIGLSMAEAV